MVDITRGRGRTVTTIIVMAASIAGAIGLSIISERHHVAASKELADGNVSVHVVDDNSVLVRTHVAAAGTVHVALVAESSLYKAVTLRPFERVASIRFDNLTPGVEYRYDAWFENSHFGHLLKSEVHTGHFRTDGTNTGS